MAQLDPEDFGKLQNQLLELREKNYGLEDALRRIKRDAETRQRALEEENSRFVKIIQISKRNSEVELLVRDNSYLRNKLKDQEEDFRLQNNTLLQELSRLIDENERYERQIKILCGERFATDAVDGDLASTDDSKEVLRLRMELTQMERKLHEGEKRMETNSKGTKEKIAGLNVQITQLRNVLKMHSIPIDEGEINIGRGEGVSFKKLSLQDDDGLESDMEQPSETLHQYQERTSQLQCELERLTCQLREEREKNACLHIDKSKLEEKLMTVNQSMVNVVSQVQDCNKSESTQLQDAELILKERESQLRSENEQIHTLLQETQNNLSVSESGLKEKTVKCECLQQELENIHLKQDDISRELNEHKALLEERETTIRDLEEKLATIISGKTQVSEQLKLMQATLDHTKEELCAMTSNMESHQTLLREQSKLAESRKSLMEEMKLHMEEERQNLQQQLKDLSRKHQEDLAANSNENQELKDQLEEMNCKISNLEEIASVFDNDKADLQEKAKKLTNDLETVHRFTEEQISRVTAEKIQDIEIMKQKFEDEQRDLQTQLEISNIQTQEAEEAVEVLKRKVADGEEEQRIHERKGMTLLKDLKKQLVVERKRADRLQEKLSQLLTDPAQLTAITTISDAGDDVSSVSSWSMVSGEPRDSSTRENSIIVSPQGSPPPGVVTEETASLVNRVTDLQQQKWQLEERITHLESSSAAMAEDILKKSAIIQHYCMERTSESSSSTPTSPVPPVVGEKLNVRRMIELIRGSAGEESLKEMNRRLQSLLEETLSKNIQLHHDVENLSEQVHKLSKLAAQYTEI